MTPIEIQESLPAWVTNSNSFSVNITDLEGNYLFVNNLFQERFRWIKENFIGAHFSITVHPEDVEKCNRAAELILTNQEEIVEIEVRKPREDSKTQFDYTHWEFSKFTNELNVPIGIFCLGFDVSKLKHFTHLLIKKNMQLAHIAQTQSHQVRGPLSSILGLTELLLDGEANENMNDQKSYLEMLQAAGKQLDEKIHEIVALTDPKREAEYLQNMEKFKEN